MSSIAPFLSQEMLNRLVDRSIDGSIDVNELVHLARFSAGNNWTSWYTMLKKVVLAGILSVSRSIYW